MIKKVILILTLPTFVFIYLESCNKPCEHKETLQIINIDSDYFSDYTTKNRNIAQLFLTYESYFVQNFSFNLTNKSYAMSKVENCFNELLNPIDSISITSKNSFSNSYPPYSELNKLFRVSNSSNYYLNNFTYNYHESNYEEDVQGEKKTEFKFINDSLPTLDSIHNLCITIYCRNGESFKDSIIEINLKSNL